jgi:hypothetical protein
VYACACCGAGATRHVVLQVQARQRQTNRSSTELGATLQAVRRLTPPGTERARRSADEQTLLISLRTEMKNSVQRMPERSIANAMYNITALRAADKILMMRALQAIESW